ncbi:MAG: hypothetical protein ACLTYW_04150 [Collinsella sp.]
MPADEEELDLALATVLSSASCWPQGAQRRRADLRCYGAWRAGCKRPPQPVATGETVELPPPR